MKLTLSKYSSDGLYTDVKLAEIGINCPYAIKLQVKRYCMTIYRWNYPTVCLSKDNSDKQQGGAMEDWAQWVLWQERPWTRFKFWKMRLTSHPTHGQL